MITTMKQADVEVQNTLATLVVMISSNNFWNSGKATSEKED